MLVGIIFSIIMVSLLWSVTVEDSYGKAPWLKPLIGFTIMTVVLVVISWGVHINMVKDAYRDIAFKKYTYEAALSSGMLTEDEIQEIINKSCTINSSLKDQKESINKWTCFDIPQKIKDEVESAEYIDYLSALNSADYYRLMSNT